MGGQVTHQSRFRLVKESLETGKVVPFSYSQETQIESILLFRSKNIVLHTGEKSQVVLHKFSDGSLSALVDTSLENPRGLQKLGDMAIMVGQRQICFFDLEKLTIFKKFQEEITCEAVECCSAIHTDRLFGFGNSGEDPSLLVGGIGNAIVHKLEFPLEVLRKFSSSIKRLYENEDLEFEDIRESEVHLETVDENQRLKKEIKLLVAKNAKLQRVGRRA